MTVIFRRIYDNVPVLFICFSDGNPDAEDAFDDEDLVTPLSPTGQRNPKKKKRKPRRLT